MKAYLVLVLSQRVEDLTASQIEFLSGVQQSYRPFSKAIKESRNLICVA